MTAVGAVDPAQCTQEMGRGAVAQLRGEWIWSLLDLGLARFPFPSLSFLSVVSVRRAQQLCEEHEMRSQEGNLT